MSRNAPTLEQTDQFLEIGRRMDQKGWVAANDGNLSILDEDGSILITATGSQNGYLTPQDIVRIDANGNVLWGGKAPSSEFGLHLTAYRERPDARSVVHAHPPLSTAFAVARECLDDCVLPEIVLTIGRIPIAPYGTPGTVELGETIAELVRSHDAILLANHGAVTLGGDLASAYFTMERVEHSAKILFHARLLGKPQSLTTSEVMRLLATDPNAKLRYPNGTLPCIPASCEPTYPIDLQSDRERLREIIRQVLEERLAAGVTPRVP